MNTSSALLILIFSLGAMARDLYVCSPGKSQILYSQEPSGTDRGVSPVRLTSREVIAHAHNLEHAITSSVIVATTN